MTAKTFRNKMVCYLEGYQEYLLLVKPNGEAVSHCSILNEFINYLYNYHLVSAIDQITVSMANSKFQADYKRKNYRAIDKETMKQIVKSYFVFIYGKYGIRNKKLMRGLEN